MLRELLAEEETIFVSIDDNELHHLRATMDEIFGADTFLEILGARHFDFFDVHLDTVPRSLETEERQLPRTP